MEKKDRVKRARLRAQLRQERANCGLGRTTGRRRRSSQIKILPAITRLPVFTSQETPGEGGCRKLKAS